MDTKKLRQKILDLAIRGKLVPQDPNDEPASVLLERIKAEKEQLIKDGKIKRSKKSASSDTSPYENVPFEIPESWVWTTIGDIFIHNTGKGSSVLDVVKTFEKASGVKIPYEMKPRRAGDVPVNYCDATKAEKELGWKAKRDLFDMCEDSWRWQKSNPNGYEA